MNENFADDIAAIGKMEAVPKILEVVCRTTGMGFAAVARVTERRWICCAVRDEIAFGLQPGGELQVATTLCDEVRDNGKLIAIDHVAEDEAYCGHPTPKMYGFQSYISVPIFRTDGRFFGTLCSIDPKPARVKSIETITMFMLFGDLIALHLDAQERLNVSEQALLDERQTAQLREQFIGVLGHDLRNPLNAIYGATQVMRNLPLSDKLARMVGVIHHSASRMAGLIDNILDFTRGRLGGGFSVTKVLDDGLQTTLQQVITEVRTIWPERVVHFESELNQPVLCDSGRIAQMFSNLLANALTHGDPRTPVWAKARSDDRVLEISVTNKGKPIPHEAMGSLFQPFSRPSDRQGLGLGLYIASEIARAHGAVIEVSSSSQETRFTCRLKTDGHDEAQSSLSNINSRG
jgi:signal transduction histidine kinase